MTASVASVNVGALTAEWAGSLGEFWDVPNLIKRFAARGAPGSYLRVLVEGSIGAGDEITVLSKPAHGFTVGMTFRALTVEPELLPLLLDVPELAAKSAANVRKRVPE